MVGKIIALLLILIGVVFVFDARPLSDKWFGFGDQNEATAGLKILGFLFSMIGAIILYVLQQSVKKILKTIDKKLQFVYNTNYKNHGGNE